jgi:hypothetical protein
VPGEAAARSNVPGLTSAEYADAWVTREGSRLTVAGRPFRFSGPNIEWLSLKNYGPLSRPWGPTRSHMDGLLNRVNTITGVAYKDDPTFVGFVEGNNLNLLNGVPPTIVEAWLKDGLRPLRVGRPAAPLPRHLADRLTRTGAIQPCP